MMLYRHFRVSRVKAAAAICLFCPLVPTFASTSAFISITAPRKSTSSASITISFSAFTETVLYDSTSTPKSLASAFAAKLSRDYLASGLCASASGGTITLKLKSGSFGAISITNPNHAFVLTPSGF